MKKRLLSMLMAMCLMATMVPAAFAADEENGRPIPDELPIVYEEDAVTPASEALAAEYPGSGTKDDPKVYIIDRPEVFEDLMQSCAAYNNGRYYDVKLAMDLDLSQFTAPAEWKAYLTFFMGTFDGGGFTISGIPENCFLFYQIHNATIGNFTLDLNGEAGTLMYYTFRIGKADGSIEWGTDKLHDINVVSTDKDEKSATVELVGNGQANYAPFMFAAGPYFTMDSCNNYANINGNTYAAVFSGYYPLPASGYPSDSYFKFIDCENHGNVTLRYAGLFFGNPTGLRADRNITFEGVKNHGAIRGTETAHFFSSDAGANDYFVGTGYFNTQENELDPKDSITGEPLSNSPMRLACDDEKCPNHDTKGTISAENELKDLGVEVVSAEDGTKYYRVQNANSNYTYKITAYHYVSIFLEQNGELVPDGTDRVSITEDVTATNDYTTTDIKDAYLHDGTLQDGTYPSEYSDGIEDVDEKDCLYFCNVDVNNVDYGYWVDSKQQTVSGHHMYISSDRNPTKVMWDVYVSAYDTSGKLVATADLTR